METAEIILADSASNDRTVEIARGFPITIVELAEHWPLSPAAGRFVGLRHARGTLVLFVDGDYVLAREWLPAAIRLLDANPRVAAVCGLDIEAGTGTSVLAQRQREWMAALDGPPEAVPIGLYRRDAIDAVGSIHPFLRGGEDRDLAERLRSQGWDLARTPVVMGRHYWADTAEMDYITYFRSVLRWSFGDGQTYRSRRTLAGARNAARLRYANGRILSGYLLGLSTFALILANVVAAARTLWYIIPIDGLAAVALLTEKSARHLTWREAAFQFHVVPYVVVRHAGFLAGFLRAVPEPSRFPTGERIVQTTNLPRR